MKRTLIIGTRKSKLALTQTEAVRDALSHATPDVKFEVKKMETTGDKAQERPLGSMNLKGAFTKELDEALLKKEIDFAVHSLKDLAAEIPEGLCLGAVTRSVDSRDVLVARNGKSLKDLPRGATVGTSSLRRIALLRKLRPDLSIAPMRGNVDTRLKKLDEAACDAIILAAAGLKRLGLEKRITEYLNPLEFVPAVGQGKLAVVAREDDEETLDLVAAVHDGISGIIALAEREFMAVMEGGCQVPLGGYGEIRGKKLSMIGFLALPDASRMVMAKMDGELDEPEQLGSALAENILNRGGKEILHALRSQKAVSG